MGRLLELMPDTGHHYYFFPLAVFDEAAVSDGYEIPKAAGLLAKTIEFAKSSGTAGTPWVAAAGTPWIRLRVGYADLYNLSAEGIAISYVAPARAIGVWLVVETNTGEQSRGYPYLSEDMLAPPAWLSPDPATWPRAPYVEKESQFVKGTQNYDLLVLYPTLAEHLKGAIDTLPFAIKWLPVVGEQFPVDLIVDFGNSRTLALLLESAQNAPGAKQRDLAQICRPLVFSDQRQDHERGMHRSPPNSHCVVDSWFILRRPEYAHTSGSRDNDEFSPENFHIDDYEISVPPKRFWHREQTLTIEKATRRIPHMFTEISPAAIGPGSYDYFAKLHGAAVRCALSSPKRYAWDKSPAGDFGDVYWHMMAPRSEPILLSGEIMAFMPVNPAERFYSDPEIERSSGRLMEKSPVEWPQEPLRNSLPRFSKSDGLVWTALSIIEQAHRNINCQATRVGGALTRRFLENIIVTFPSGWTQEEIENYYQAWQYARNIFFWSRYRKPEDGEEPAVRHPRVMMHVDEAVASQLPVIYSEIRHLGNDIGLWLELFGRDRGGQKSCRVMSIDIGGGTLDTAVVEYSRPGQRRPELKPKILFTDSSTRAGDKLVKTIIDEVLIPYLLTRNSDASTQASIREVLTRRNDFAAVNKRVAWVKLVFIPIVVQWLSDLSAGVLRSTARSPAECNVNYETLRDFNATVRGGSGDAEVLPHLEGIDVEYKKLNDVITAWIMHIAEAHARYLAAFQCDLVVVTGKPSEIVTIRGILETELPIEPYRIIFARGYYAGNWLPLGGSGNEAKRIQDAKFVTATGAALAQAFDRNLLADFSLSKIERGDKPLPNWWYHLNDSGTVAGEPLLTPEAETAEVEVSPNMTIGRVRFPGSEPERVYVFRSKSGKQYSQLKARLKRILTDADRKTALLSERLELTAVSGIDEDGQRVDADDFELHLNTLGGNYWLDEPEFDLSFET